MSMADASSGNADLLATLSRLTAAVEKAHAATEARLASIEARLSALEQKKAGPLDEALSKVSAVEGVEPVKGRIDEVLLRLLDPETLESIARIAVLAPRLEYALQAVAAGPELLEEGLDLVRKGANGGPSPDVRLRAAIDAAGKITAPESLRALAGVAGRVPVFEGTLDAAAQATSALEAVHGRAAQQRQLTDLLIALGDPETMESLTRVVALAPKLEYAAQAVAAGPELLEEALALVKKTASDRLGSGAPMDRRVEALADAGRRLTEPSVIEPLTSVAAAAAKVAPVLTVSVDALDRSAGAQGRAEMEQRVSEVVLALSDLETLESLGRIVALLPKIEYAVQGLAAGPELLEEALASVRTWSRARLGDAGAVDRRIAESLDAVLTLTQPSVLGPLTKTLPALLSVPGLVESLPQFTQHAPRFGASIDRAMGALDRAAAKHEVKPDDVDRRLEEGFDLLLELTDPKRMAAMKRASALMGMVDDSLNKLSEKDATRGVKELVRIITALGQPEMLASFRRTLDALPGLSNTLAALPVQPHTLELLRNVNEAIEEARGGGETLGVWGLMRVIREPEVQTILTLGVDLARRLGGKLGQKPVARLKS